MPFDLPINSKFDLSALPDVFIERLKKIIPASRLPGVVESFFVEKKITFRLNSLIRPRIETRVELTRCGIDFEIVDWLNDRDGEPIACLSDRKFRDQLTHSSMADSGQIYLQNLSSMLAPWILQAGPGDAVLDLAAAPGGKTIQLAEQMKNTGQLSAVEAIRQRMFRLQANLKRCGVTNCKTYLTDGRTVGMKTPERFDKVLLDAPCSSESRFRGDDPESFSTWSLRKLRETSRKQLGLLKAAIHATKVGGEILYCTCSFAPEENEQVVHKALMQFEDAIDLVPIAIPEVNSIPMANALPIANALPGLVSFDENPFSSVMTNCLRILPDSTMDAFFLAKLVKNKRTRRE